MSGIIIRKAKIDDARGISRVHVQAWKDTYRDLLSAEFLETLSVDKRKEMWEEVIKENDPTNLTYVALEGDNVIGFANAGPSRDEAQTHEVELRALYVLERCQRQGTGRKLFQQVVDGINAMGFHSLYLWVLDGNPTIDFYEKMKGQRGETKQDKIGEQTVDEVLYFWDKL